MRTPTGYKTNAGHFVATFNNRFKFQYVQNILSNEIRRFFRLLANTHCDKCLVYLTKLMQYNSMEF